MSSKRILIIGWADSVHIQRWCSGLSKRGFDIKLISVGGKPLDSVDSVIFPRDNQLSYLKCLSGAKKEARKFAPDLVHAHYIAGNGLIALWTGIQPMVASVWGADIIDLPKWPFYRWIINRVLKKATHVTATSDFLKKVTLEFNRSVVEKISVIPFGIEIPLETKLFPPPRPFKICFLKSLRPKYGPDILLTALELVKEQLPDIRLTLAGAGPEREKLERMISELKLENNVVMPGFIPNKEVYGLIEQHHALVMPSVMDSESFGVAAIEASACARPVIASRVGGVPEVVKDGQTGILVPAGDSKTLAEAILKLANDFELCDKMGREGREFVRQHYQWERSLDLMSQLYENINHESPQNKN